MSVKLAIMNGKTETIADSRISTIWILLLLVVSLVGCDRGKTTSKASVAEPAPLKVIATTFAAADLARQIGGRYVSVEWMIESGQSIGSFSPTPDLRARLGTADLVLVGGITEPWALPGGDLQAISNHAIRFDGLIPAESATTQATTRAPSADDSNAEPGTGYAWLDPRAAARACAEVARQFSVRRPTHDVYFQSQGDRLAAAITAADQKIAAEFNAMPASQRRILALSSEFDFFAGRYGIDVNHLVTSSRGTLNDAQVRRLNDAATATGATVLLLPGDAVSAQVAEVSRRTGLKAVLLDPYGSASIAGRSSYKDLLEYNATMLRDAMKR